jgi:N-methylhydantoinase B
MPGSAISIARVVDTDIAVRIEAGSPLPDRLKEIDGKLEWLICKHTRSPILAGDVWYHSWQGGGGFGDPLLREPERVADDLARGAISRHAAEEIYGVVVARNGSADVTATEGKRSEIRAKRRQSNERIDMDGTSVSYKGHGRAEIGPALVVDVEADSVSCGQCRHRHCGIRDNLLNHLGFVASPLWAAGPVRGEAYDSGRFKLRQFVCRNCGGLVDVQVGLDGAPLSYARPEIGVPAA